MVPDAFKNYNTLGYKVLDKSADEMRAFLTTGNFPAPNNNNATEATQAPAYSAPPVPNAQPAHTVAPTYGAPTGQGVPSYNPGAAGYNTPNVATGGYVGADPTSGTARPNRYY